MFKRKPPHEWADMITPEWRVHFEKVGLDSVQFDVSNHRYKSPTKQYAALAWMHEKRASADRVSIVTLWVAIAALLATILGIVVSLLIAAWPLGV